MIWERREYYYAKKGVVEGRDRTGSWKTAASKYKHGVKVVFFARRAAKIAHWSSVALTELWRSAQALQKNNHSLYYPSTLPQQMCKDSLEFTRSASSEDDRMISKETKSCGAPSSAWETGSGMNATRILDELVTSQRGACWWNIWKVIWAQRRLCSGKWARRSSDGCSNRWLDGCSKKSRPWANDIEKWKTRLRDGQCTVRCT